MENIKAWYLSRTVWGAAIAIAASLLHLTGIDVQAADQMELTDTLVTIGGAAGALVALYGRVRARSTLVKRAS